MHVLTSLPVYEYIMADEESGKMMKVTVKTAKEKKTIEIEEDSDVKNVRFVA